MKFLALFAVLLLCVDLSLQLPKLINCPPDFEIPSSIANSCGVFTCGASNSIAGKGCGVYQCAPGKTIGIRETDNTLPYPDCCGGPICAD